MLDGDALDTAIQRLIDRFDSVTSFYIEKVAGQIRTIGELNRSSINIISIFTDMYANMGDINTRLAKALAMNRTDLMAIYQQALNDVYIDPRFKRAIAQKGLSKQSQQQLVQYVRSVTMQSQGELDNLSNTTLTSETYRHAVTDAVLAVSSGMGDYRAATREILRKVGSAGMQVQYPSGARRRIDTALRQNITNGAKQIYQNGSKIMGEALGYDAYEISAHAQSAPDHEPVQGHILLISEYDKMQAGEPFTDIDGNHFKGFRRPIGEWNCMHFPISFSTEYSVRHYKPETLKDWADRNRRGCEIGGKHYTLYEATQLMRRIETQIRQQKDIAIAAEHAGDDVLRAACQIRINKLGAYYSAVAAASGQREKRERMVVPGFHKYNLTTRK